MNPQEQAALNHDRAGAILENQRAIMVNQATILQNQNKIMRGLENMFAILPSLQPLQNSLTGHIGPQTIQNSAVPLSSSVSVTSESSASVLPLRVPSVSLIPATAAPSPTVPEHIAAAPLVQPSLPQNTASITAPSNVSIPSTSCNIPDNPTSNSAVTASEVDMKPDNCNANESVSTNPETNQISPSLVPSTVNIQIENSSLMPISTCEEPFAQLLSHEELLQMRVKSCSVGNFAVHVLRRICNQADLENKNCSGSRGKGAVDQRRLRYVKETVFSMYGVSAAEKIQTWRQCVRAIDEFLRRPKRASYKIRVKNPSHATEM